VVALFRTAILAFAHPADSLPGGLEHLLLHVKAEWEAQPRHRNPVFARDGWRCAVPACTARRELHDHHLVFRSHGGGNGRENRLTLCAWHHLRGIHADRVRARGEAPAGVTEDGRDAAPPEADPEPRAPPSSLQLAVPQGTGELDPWSNASRTATSRR
jgi:hypothetical protein